MLGCLAPQFGVWQLEQLYEQSYVESCLAGSVNLDVATADQRVRTE